MLRNIDQFIIQFRDVPDNNLTNEYKKKIDEMELAAMK